MARIELLTACSRCNMRKAHSGFGEVFCLDCEASIKQHFASRYSDNTGWELLNSGKRALCRDKAGVLPRIKQVFPNVIAVTKQNAQHFYSDRVLIGIAWRVCLTPNFWWLALKATPVKRITLRQIV